MNNRPHCGGFLEIRLEGHKHYCLGLPSPLPQILITRLVNTVLVFSTLLGVALTESTVSCEALSLMENKKRDIYNSKS